MPETRDDVAKRVLVYWRVADMLAVAHGLETATILAQVHEESGGNPEAFPEHPERDGASFGLMQIELPTAREVGYDGTACGLCDPVRNLTIGVLYLQSLVREYRNPWLALIAYNGGPRAVTYYRMGWRTGPSVHYANAVYALAIYYQRRLADLKARAARS